MDSDSKALDETQVDILSVIERTCSVFSLLGSLFVIATFCLSKAFHKPINRLVFYASFGNLITNVATLMARGFLDDTGGAGCQFQGFLIQMFMPADAFWTLAMAVNVYLTFYFKFDAQRLRRMEVPYLICCYGIPFIVAISFVFVKTEEKGKMYGDATLWCWISQPWDIFRIATFYGPVWVVILITIFIYVRAGREIWKKRQQLAELRYSTSHHEPEPLPPMDDPFNASKTTEVFVTTEVVDKDRIDLSPLGDTARRGSETANAAPKPPGAAYSVHISSNRNAANRESNSDIVLPIQSNVVIDISAAPPRTAGGVGGSNPNRRKAAHENNSAIWSYTKCAILFFTALLVTWIPSSANRVYGVVNPGQTATALEYMSALVLPLQGFWNAVIYIVTSWKACKIFFGDLVFLRNRPIAQDLGVAGLGGSFQMMSSGRNGSKSSENTYESESMTELAKSRPQSSQGGMRTPQESSEQQHRHFKEELV